MKLLSDILRAALLWLHLRNAAEYTRQVNALDHEIDSLREKQAYLRASHVAADQRLATALLVRLRQAEAARSVLTARFAELGGGPAHPDPARDLHPGKERAVVRAVGGVGVGSSDPTAADTPSEPIEVRRALPV